MCEDGSQCITENLTLIPFLSNPSANKHYFSPNNIFICP